METAGFYQADVDFETPGERRLEVFPVELFEKTSDLWQRLKERSFDDPTSYRLKQFDEAPHLFSRTRSGKKTVVTQNYKLGEAMRSHTRDLVFLSATPHQGHPFPFWSLIQLLNDQLFSGPEDLHDHRGVLSRVMIRQTKREVTNATGNLVFRRRQVHTERFPLAPKERGFTAFTHWMRVRSP